MSDDSHELLVRIKNLVLELGYVPSRDVFAKHIPSGRRRIAQQFGTYAAFLQAAGYSRRDVAKAPDLHDVFTTPLQKHLNESTDKIISCEHNFPRLVSISDIHWPFHNPRVLEKLFDYLQDNLVDHVILNGDAWDMYSHTKFPRSHLQFTAREETQSAQDANKQFWIRIKQIVPNAECIQLMGNHDVRPLKRILEVYPVAEDWIADKLRELFTFEGVRTIMDPREECIINDISIFHGFKSKLGEHRDYVGRSTINGHTHVGGVVFRACSDGRILFEGNSGFAGNPYAKGLTYTPLKTTNWTPGFLACDKYGPRFIPA